MKNLVKTTVSRQLDAKIAESLFGWRWCDLENGRSLLLPPEDDERTDWASTWDIDGYPAYLPHYSERKEKAWGIVEKLMEDGVFISIWPNKNGVRVQSEYGNSELFMVYAENLPLALCRAALTYLQIKDGKI